MNRRTEYPEFRAMTLCACFLGSFPLVSCDRSPQAAPVSEAPADALRASKAQPRRYAAWLAESRVLASGDIGSAKAKIRAHCQAEGLTLAEFLKDVHAAGQLSPDEFASLVKTAIFAAGDAREKWDIASLYLKPEEQDAMITSIIGQAWKDPANLEWMSLAHSSLPEGETRSTFSKYIFAAHLTNSDVPTASRWIADLPREEGIACTSIYRDSTKDLNKEQILGMIGAVAEIKDRMVAERINEFSLSAILSSQPSVRERLDFLAAHELGSAANMEFAARTIVSPLEADEMTAYLAAADEPDVYAGAFGILGQAKGKGEGLWAAYQASLQLPVESRRSYLSGAVTPCYLAEGHEKVISTANEIPDPGERVYFLQRVAEGIPLNQMSDKLRVIESLPNSEWKSKMLSSANDGYKGQDGGGR